MTTNTTTVLKIGGSVLEPAPAPAFMAAVARTVAAGEKLVIVHGGGKALNALLGRLGVATEFKNGLRVTGAATLQAAVMAFAGEVNTQLVAALNRAGVAAVGLTGLDASSVRAQVADPGLGAVGIPDAAEARLPRALLDAGYIPVYASLASDGDGGVLNVNADQFAASLAGALGAERMLFVTDVPGVLDANGGLIPQISLAGMEAMAASGAIRGGMLPKADACRAALAGGAGTVTILGAEAALRLDEIIAGPGAGTPCGTQVTRA
ncbi:MAG TPA: acetylglutamate kinase [Terriglobales bacterium]